MSMTDERFCMRHLAPGAPESPYVVRRIWRRMEEDRLTRATFYDGSVTTADGLVHELLECGALSFALFWEGYLCGAAWFGTRAFYPVPQGLGTCAHRTRRAGHLLHGTASEGCPRLFL